MQIPHFVRDINKRNIEKKGVNDEQKLKMMMIMKIIKLKKIKK